MLRASRKLIVPVLVLTTLALAGCGTLTPYLTSAGALDAFKPISNSEGAPCTMQREVAAHNSVYDTLKKGTDVTYKAPCDVAPKAAPAKKAPDPQKVS